jgi:hypothetical protein
VRQGLATVVPPSLLPMLTWQELEYLVCVLFRIFFALSFVLPLLAASSTQVVGARKVDVDLLQTTAMYEGCSENDRHIQLFWKMMRDRFDDEKRSKFLTFGLFVLFFVAQKLRRLIWFLFSHLQLGVEVCSLLNSIPLLA